MALMVMQASMLEEIVSLLGQRRSLDRLEMERLVKGLEISEANVLRYAGCGGRGVERKLMARNDVLECAFCEWPDSSEASFATNERNFEVIRVLEGKLTLTERQCVALKMRVWNVGKDQWDVLTPSNVLFSPAYAGEVLAIKANATCALQGAG